jgi:hypothetical protein
LRFETLWPPVAPATLIYLLTLANTAKVMSWRQIQQSEKVLTNELSDGIVRLRYRKEKRMYEKLTEEEKNEWWAFIEPEIDAAAELGLTLSDIPYHDDSAMEWLRKRLEEIRQEKKEEETQ